ncbi:YceK/YidQ family lipoprotein [Shewanella xiamenensis]|nr:YceK/YidQ family lipoprotein [Shewanella xiamenensis]MEE1981386.1 YceK/YidQ family lipoprotein [Shewanella xiamenensis]PHY62808.1 YceK/YidQ family lipoprotein [Shewanella xiamenensis]
MSIYTLTPEFEKELLKPDPCPQGCRINRVYSGSKLGICALSSGGGGQGAGIMFWDLPFSMALDTVVLPYTIYKQATVGGSITLQGLEGECEKAEE